MEKGRKREKKVAKKAKDACMCVHRFWLKTSKKKKKKERQNECKHEKKKVRDHLKKNNNNNNNKRQNGREGKKEKKREKVSNRLVHVPLRFVEIYILPIRLLRKASQRGGSATRFP